MLPFAVISITLTIASLAEAETTSFCELPITSKQHYHRQWPLVSTTNGVLYDTSEINDELIVRIKNGEQVLLSCGPNYFKKFYKVETLIGTCNANTDSFVVNDVEIKIRDLTCDLRVIEEVVYPVDGCTDDKLSTSTFGYIDPVEKSALVLGESCYDTAAGKTLWAHVKLGQNAYLQKAEKSFFTAHQHPDTRYKIELFRGLNFANIYERIRTHLHIKNAPELKITNYIDEPLLKNAQYQAVKKLGWNYFVTYDNLKVLETLKLDIQNFGKQHDLDVYVGSYGVHSLHGANGEKMNIYLHVSGNDDLEGRFPMPELIWFIVKQQNKAIAFGIYNNPDITEAMISDNAICKNECDKVSWLSETMKSNVNHKPLICCSYDELEKTVQQLPKLEDVNELLI